MKRIWKTVLSLMTAITLVLIGGISVRAEDSGLYVKGIAVTEDNAQDILGNGAVSYDFENRTLTLNNAVITSEGMTEGSLIAYEGEGTLNIHIVSYSKLLSEIPDVKAIDVSCDELVIRGVLGGDFMSIYSKSDGISFGNGGSGLLTIEGLEIMFNTDGEESRAIAADRLTVKLASIRIEGKDPMPAVGIHTYGDIEVSDSEISGGTISRSFIISDHGDMRLISTMVTGDSDVDGICLSEGSLIVDKDYEGSEPSDILVDTPGTALNCPNGSVSLYGRSRLDLLGNPALKTADGMIDLSGHEIGGVLIGENELWDDVSDLGSRTSLKVPGLIFCEAEEPTVQEDGHTGYWTNHTGILYGDEEGSQILSEADVILPKIVYTLLSGGGSTYMKTSAEGLSFTISRSRHDKETRERTQAVLVDDEEISEYELSAGSVIVSLPAAYLDRLASGEHELQVMFDDGGEVRTSFTIAEEQKEDEPAAPSGPEDRGRTSPDTSDHSQGILWRNLLLFSLLTYVLVLTVRIRWTSRRL